MADLTEILRYWAADREGAPAFGISEITFDIDKGWAGTPDTPGDPAEVVVTYMVTKKQVYRVEANELGGFITELADVAGRGPLITFVPPKNPKVEEARAEIDFILASIDPTLNPSYTMGQPVVQFDNTLRNKVGDSLMRIDKILKELL